jgi:hypothetical protein
MRAVRGFGVDPVVAGSYEDFLSKLVSITTFLETTERHPPNPPT